MLSRIETAQQDFDTSQLGEKATLIFGPAAESGSITIPVSGFGGCNIFGARAAVTGDRISFNEMVATEIFCPPPPGELEGAYFEVLTQAARYRTGDAKLVIETRSGAKLTFIELLQ